VAAALATWFTRRTARSQSRAAASSAADHGPTTFSGARVEAPTPSWGAARIKRDHRLKLSERALRRIWREAGLLRRKRRKHHTKQNLRAVKQQWRLFEQTCIDTKDLKDTPELWPQLQRCQLPLVQYTAREVVSGWQFIAYAQERTLAYSQLFAQIIITHLLSCGVKFKDSRFQADNGGEFIGWSA